jgi:hypothetical protein
MTHVSPLDTTEACPLAETCAVCGSSNRLHTTTYDGEIGVWCCTVCADCVVGGRRPQLAPGPEKLAIVAHCEHLGISTDEMVRRHHEEAEHDQFLQRPLDRRYADVSTDVVMAALRERDYPSSLDNQFKPPPSPDKLRQQYEGSASRRTPGQWRALVEGSYTERKRSRERTPDERRRMFEGPSRGPDPDA